MTPELADERLTAEREMVDWWAGQRPLHSTTGIQHPAG
jgi:hypothetical protein